MNSLQFYVPANCLFQESVQDGNRLSAGLDSAQSNINPLQSRNRGIIYVNAKEVKEHFMESGMAKLTHIEEETELMN